MRYLEVSRSIRAPAETAWSCLTDTRLWPVWGPSVRAVECPRRIITLGTEGRIQTVLGLWLGFQITALEPGESWRWRVAGVPATGHRVRAVGPTVCTVQFEVPPLARPYVPVCVLALRRIAGVCEGARSGV